MNKIGNLPGRVAAHGLVRNHNGEILILKRSELDKDEKNCWDLPGGGLEKGESIETGFARELKEEAGIEAANIEVFGVHEVDDGSLGLFVSAQTMDSEIKLSEEHSEYKWVSENDFLLTKPAGLHLRALQSLLTNNKRVINFKDTPEK